MADVCPCHGKPWYVFKTGRLCIVKKRAKDRAWSVTEAGRARRRRADARYRTTHMRIRVGDSCNSLYLGTYPVTPEQREAIQAFRSKQRKENNGRLNPAIA